MAAADRSPRRAGSARSADAVEGALRALRDAVARLSGDARAADLSALRVSPGVRAELERAGATRVDDLARLSAEQVRAMRHVGERRIDAVAAAIDRLGVPGADPAPKRRRSKAAVRDAVDRLPVAARALPVLDLGGLSARTRNALSAASVTALGDLPDDRALLALPGFGVRCLRDLRAAIQTLADDLASLPAPSLHPDLLLDELLLRRPLLAEVDRRIAAASDPRERLVLELRWFHAGARAPLEAIARRFSITRERVRQIELRLIGGLRGDLRLARLVDASLQALRAGRTAPLDLTTAERLDPWLAGAAADPAFTRGALHALGCAHRVIEGEAGEPAILAPAGADPAALVRELISRCGRDANDAARERAARALLEERRAPELLPLLVQRARRVAPRSHRALVLEALAAARRPMHVGEITAELARAGVAVSARKVHGILIDQRVPRAGPSTYVHPHALAGADAGAVGGDVLALLAETPDKQWSSDDLLAELRRRGAGWAARVEVPAFEHALRASDAVRDLGRGTWGLRGRHRARLRVADVLERVLVEAGSPLALEELLERAARIRSIRAVGLSLEWPLVGLPDGRVALAERDLGISAESLRALFDAASARLSRSSASIQHDELEALWAEVRPAAPRVPGEVLARALAAAGTGLSVDRASGALRRARRRGPARTPRARLQRLTPEALLALLERVGGPASVERVRRALRSDLDLDLSRSDVAALLRAARGGSAAGASLYDGGPAA